MPKRGTLKTIAVIAVSFTAFASATVLLWANKIVSPAMATLMIVALFGLYFGFGILIAIYRLVSKLE